MSGANASPTGRSHQVMMPQDRQRLKILSVLLVVLGLTLVFAYQMNRPPTASAVRTPDDRPSAAPPTSNDARIRLDLLDKGDPAEAIGDTNLFQYRMGRSAPAGPQVGTPGVRVPAPGAPETMPENVPARPVTPPQPPPPPPIPFKYEGFAVVNSSEGTLTAFISENNSARHYNVTVGEVLMGRFRVARITDSLVEIEDLEYNRRQTLPLIK